MRTKLLQALAVVTALVLVGAGLAFPATGNGPAAGSASSSDGASYQQSSAKVNETNLTAGSQLSGAFATHQTSLGGDLERRTLAVQLSGANTTERARRLARLESSLIDRQERLGARRERLQASLENGSVSPGGYLHTMASLQAEAVVTGELAEQGASAARTLPPSVASEYNVSADSFRALANRSRTDTERLASTFETESASVFGWNTSELLTGQQDRSTTDDPLSQDSTTDLNTTDDLDSTPEAIPNGTETLPDDTDLGGVNDTGDFEDFNRSDRLDEINRSDPLGEFNRSDDLGGVNRTDGLGEFNESSEFGDGWSGTDGLNGTRDEWDGINGTDSPLDGGTTISDPTRTNETFDDTDITTRTDDDLDG